MQKGHKAVLPKGIQSRLFLLIALAVLPLLLLFGWASWQQYETRRVQEMQTELEVSRGVATTFATYVAGVQRKNYAIGQAITITTQDNLETITRLLNATTSESPAIRNRSWVNPDGLVLASTLPGLVGRDLSVRSYFREVKAGQPWAIGDLTENGISSAEPTFAIATAIRDEQGTLLGLVVAGLEPNRLNEVTLTQQRPQGGAYAIFDRNGTVVYRSLTPTLTWQQRTTWIQDDVLLQKALKTRQEQTGIVHLPVIGGTWVSARVPVEGIGYVVGAGRPVEIVFAPLQRRLIQDGVLALMVGSLAFLLASLLARTISNPISRLAADAQQMAFGIPAAQDDAQAPKEVRALRTKVEQMAKDLIQRAEALNASEERHRILAAVVENTTHFVGIANADLKPFYVNEAGRKMVGLDTVDAIYQTNIFDYFVPEDRPRIEQEAIPSLLKNGRWSAEVEFQHFKTGEPIATQLNAFTIKDELGNPIAYATISPDLRHLKEVEQALQEANIALAESEMQIRDQYAELDQIYRYAPVGLFTFDTEYRFQRINERMAEINGFPPEYQIGKSMYEIVPNLADFLREVYRPVLERGEPVLEVEVHGQTPKEPEVERDWICSYFPWRSGSGEIIGLIGAVLEVTARKHAERALRESEERFRTSVESMLDGFAILSAVREAGKIIDFRYEYINEAGCRLNHLSYEEQIGERLLQRHPGLQQSALFERYVHLVENGIPVILANETHDALFGNHERLQRNYELSAVKLNDGIAVTWRDITERKLLEEALQQSNKDLQNFAFMASHDLNEPLRKIAHFGRIIQANLDNTLDEHNRDLLNRMQNSVQRMGEMVNALLDLSRVNTHGQPFETVDLGKITHEVVSDLESLIQRNQGRVTVEDMPLIQADPLQIRHLLQNLIANAIKFHLPDVPPEVHISASEISDWNDMGAAVAIQVKDNGIGFDMEYFERIVQPFQRLESRSAYEGTGMGLAICKRIVERHKGKLEAYSQPGEGATFTIFLPKQPFHSA